MIHLIWSTINGIIVIYFFYLIFGFIRKGKRIFNPKFKTISIFIMIIGIIQIKNASNSKENSNLIIISENYNEQNESNRKDVILEENLTFDINLSIRYSSNQNEYIPIESYSTMTGLVSGYVWEFKSIQTNNYKPNEKPEFIADGILKWNLFGITVYSESKTFNGTIK